jgi:hypothetical protein
MEQKFVLGRGSHRESAIGQATRNALNAPPPKDGEIRRTALPDTFDGIRFEIGRMIEYVSASVKDPVVRNHTAEVCAIATESARMNGASLGASEERDLSLQAIDKWCREHFVYVNDPPNVEVLQTPRRMIKASKVPPDVIRTIIDPLYEAMTAAATPGAVAAYEPPGICSGDCDEAGALYLSACAAAPCQEPIRPLRFRFGGHDGTLHHVWSYVGCGEKMIDADLTEPGFGLGDFSKFEHYEEVEIPL